VVKFQLNNANKFKRFIKIAIGRIKIGKPMPGLLMLSQHRWAETRAGIFQANVSTKDTVSFYK
jgi:hypothetical protein